MSGDLVVELLGVILAPLIIGLFFLAFDRRRERTSETTDVYVRYHSKLVLEARAAAWAFLTSTYAANPQPWSIFFSDQRAAEIDREPFWEAHDPLVMARRRVGAARGVARGESCFRDIVAATFLEPVPSLVSRIQTDPGRHHRSR